MFEAIAAILISVFGLYRVRRLLHRAECLSRLTDDDLEYLKRLKAGNVKIPDEVINGC